MLQWARRGNQQRWERVVRVLLALLLVVVLAYIIAQTVWLIGYGPNDAIPASGLKRVNAADDRHGGTALSQAQVQDWHLFGVYQKELAKSTGEVNAPETRLQLELLGLFQTRDRARSSAIIAQKGQDSELYHIGDDIPGNAKLEDIYADRVILRRKGRLETLRLNDLSTLGGVTQVTEPTPASPAPSPQTDLSRQRGILIHRLGLKPIADGANQGYRIGKQAPENLIKQVGLKKGDVIVSVNGYPLGTEDSDLAALQSYQDTRAATIVVDRGDQKFTVNYPP